MCTIISADFVISIIITAQIILPEVQSLLGCSAVFSNRCHHRFENTVVDIDFGTRQVDIDLRTQQVDIDLRTRQDIP
jgi:hypothetical protein